LAEAGFTGIGEDAASYTGHQSLDEVIGRASIAPCPLALLPQPQR
jgi:hypothetical protein